MPRCVLFHQSPVSDRLADQPFELIDVERFFDIVERSVPHRLDGGGHCGMRGYHHDLSVQPSLFDLDDEIHAVHARHLQIGQYAIEAFSIQNLESLRRAGAADHIVTGRAQHLGHRLACLAMIVDDHHAAGLGAG